MTRLGMRWMIGSVLVAAAVALWLFFKEPSLQQHADSIQQDLARIRGRSFVAPIDARYSSREDTAAYIDAQLARMPDMASYGKVVRKLGLYNGPLIENPRAVIRELIVSSPEGGVGYYDEKLQTVFIEKQARASIPLRRLAHELHHAFQDQHFDVTTYLLEKSFDGSLNPDEALARRAVVEGEATYLSIVWDMQRAHPETATRPIPTEVIRRQTPVDRETLLERLSRPNAPPQARAALDLLQRTPGYIYDSLYVPYRDGASFVSSVQQSGWSEVDKLYAEYPPESTEQILHPEKWFAREKPVRVQWPPLDTNPLFSEWTLLVDNVLGEAQWRCVFKEQGLTREAKAAAQGWNGDRYAVLERKRDGALLLLWHTTWDTPADAAFFARTYRRLLETKYASQPRPTRVEEKGQNVFIVEGGDEASIDAYLGFVAEVK